MDLFYPQIAVRLGGYTFKKGIAVTVCSDAASDSDWATVRFTSALGSAVTLKKLDAARVYLGYDGSFTKVFDGLLTTGFSASTGSIKELRLRDAAIRLAGTPVNHAFVNATPQEVVRTCCRLAGITEVVTADTAYPAKTYPVFGITALQAIKGINHHWGIAATGYMQDGAYRWNSPPDQTEMMLFEYGKNIVSLTKEGGLWALTTVSVPTVRHSVKIALAHPQLSGTFTVQKVIFTSEDRGFIRTKIYFKGASA